MPPALNISARRSVTVEDIRHDLSPECLPAHLDRFGIDGDDAVELISLAPQIRDDPELIEEVTALANRLQAHAGATCPVVPVEEDRLNALQARVMPGEGLLAIYAFICAADTVRRWHASRGFSVEQSDTVLADLGQQLRVHRACTGKLGLHQLDWVTINWTGKLLQCGRLQFTLERRSSALLDGALLDGALLNSAFHNVRSEPKPAAPASRWVLGTHIPATGPLDPEAVDESFAAAARHMREHFSDLGAQDLNRPIPFGREFVCDSWLINPELSDILGPDSRLARFASRWRIVSSTDDHSKAALFFVFNSRTARDPNQLPRRSRLERGVADRLRDGRGWSVGTGVLQLPGTILSPTR